MYSVHLSCIMSYDIHKIKIVMLYCLIAQICIKSTRAYDLTYVVFSVFVPMCALLINYRLINAYYLLRENLDKLMHAR